MAARRRTSRQRHYDLLVLDFIERHPGAHLAKIARCLRLEEKLVMNSLRHLERRSRIYCEPETLIDGALVTGFRSNRLKESMKWLLGKR